MIENKIGRRRRSWIVWVSAGLLLVAHGFAGWAMTKRLSPVWDEIVNPAAGLSQWQTGTIRINPQHPFLSKLICSFPLWVRGDSLPFDHPSWASGDYFRFGYEFAFRGKRSPRDVIEDSRIPMVILSVGTGAVLFLWLFELWGSFGALVGLISFVSTPVLSARSGLALLEMPQYFFLVLVLAAWTKWVRSSRLVYYGASIVAGGLAVGCKLSSLALLGPLVLAELFRPVPGVPWGKRWWRAVGWGGGVAVVFCSLYIPWQNGLASLKDALFFPLAFGATHNQCYFAGLHWENAPAFFTWAMFFLKAPPFVIALAVIGAWSWHKSGQERTVGVVLLVLVGVGFLSVLLMGTALSTVQVSTVYLPLVGLVAGIGARSWGRWGRLCLAMLSLGALLDIGWAFPNPLAYFTPLAGGKNQGYRWVSDSDQDWGQWIPALKTYWEKEGRPGLLLAYSGPCDPAAYGLSFQDLFSSALYVRDFREPLTPLDDRRVLLAVGTKMLQTEPRLFHWLVTHMKPSGQPDPCFFVYDLSREPEAFCWAAAIYKETNRPHHAQWALNRAQKSGVACAQATR